MGKYDPLAKFLSEKGDNAIPLSFAEIEQILGFPLPSSQANRAWWSNNPNNNVMTKAWLSAGYESAKVDVEAKKIVFHRTRPKPGANASELEKADGLKTRHPLFGALKGSFTIAEGVDLTEPAFPEWADMINDPNWGKTP